MPGYRFPSLIPQTGEITQAQIFVAVLGASSYTYAEAQPSQELEHWIGGPRPRANLHRWRTLDRRT